MKLPQTGGCQCGAIRYEITEAPPTGLRLPLSGLPTSDQQRLLHGGRRSREGFSAQRRRAAFASAARRQRSDQHAVGLPRLRLLDCWPGQGWPDPRSGQARSTTHRGCGRRGTSGPAASSPGSRSPRAMRSSRRSLPHEAADAEARLGRGSCDDLRHVICSFGSLSPLRQGHGRRSRGPGGASADYGVDGSFHRPESQGWIWRDLSQVVNPSTRLF